MKIGYMFGCLLICCQILNAQYTRHSFRHHVPKHCAPNVATLSHDLNKEKSISYLKNKFPIIGKEDAYYIPALIKLSEIFNQKNFAKYDIRINTKAGSIYSIHIPLIEFNNFLKVEGIEYIELAHKSFPKLEDALMEANVDLVHQGFDLSQAYSGKDVVIGIIDIGFDYTHPVFRDAEGNLRIKRSWEQNRNRIPPLGYSYGDELKGDRILNEKIDFNDISHGTSVANIAAGRDSRLGGKYNGVAFMSDLIFVSSLQFDGLSGLNTSVIDGIDYIFKYAESNGKPAVINISQGHHTGPHDGTSLTDQAIDALSGAGRIIVGSVGNEGDPNSFFLHFDHTFDSENSILTYLVWPDGISAGETVVEIWGEVGQDFNLNIEIFNPNTKKREAISEMLSTQNPNTMIDGVLIDDENDTMRYTGIMEINPLNGRPHISMYVNNLGQAKRNDVNFENLLNNDFVQLRFSAERGTVHAYSANNINESFFTDLSGIGADEFIENIRVIGGNPNYTMGELGGTAQSIISVGAYTTKLSFVNTDNDQITFSDEVIGDYYHRSSRGPTHDGRIKPDIMAPGNILATAENSFNTKLELWREVDVIDKGDGNKWTFAAKWGTSYSSPIIAGIVALMLEADPQLSPSEIKELLNQNADRDNFTGDLPNNVWGFGKVNAHTTLTSMNNPTSNAPYKYFDQIIAYPNPSSGTIYLPDLKQGQYNLKLLDIHGRNMYEQALTNYVKGSLSLPDLENGVYILQVESRNEAYQSKIIIEK